MAMEPIQIDQTAASGQVSTSNSGSSNFMDLVQLGISSASPAVESSLVYAGNSSAAAIYSAAANATYDSAVVAAGGSPSYMYSSSTPYTTGGTASYLTTSSYGSTDPTSTDLEAVMQDGFSSNAYLIGIQAQMGQATTQFTAISNILKASDDARKQAVRNTA